MVAIYCTYLTMSAVSMEPDDKSCNPLLRANSTRTASIIMGAIITLLTIAYTTTRAATQGVALGSNGAAGYSQLADTDGGEHGLVTQQPSERREMRAEALRAAVESGSLPASALDDSDDDDSSDGGYDGSSKDDERGKTQYNYSLFHIIFLLATAWVATLLTMNIREEKGASAGTGADTNFMPVGRTYGASWVKIISGWVCYAIYTWSLVAPVALPDRFGY
jgi:hypothetical protein